MFSFPPTVVMLCCMNRHIINHYFGLQMSWQTCNISWLSISGIPNQLILIYWRATIKLITPTQLLSHHNSQSLTSVFLRKLYTFSVCAVSHCQYSEYLQCKKSFIWEFGKTLSTLSGITYQPRMCRILETCVTHRIPTLATSAPYTHTCTSWWGWLACRKTEHSAPARPPQLSMKIKLYVESTKV